MKQSFLFIFFIYISFTYAQRTVKGVVIDEKDKSALAFANIMLNSTTGVVSDFNGHFEIQVPNDQRTLIISYIGYQTKTLTLKPQQNFYTVKLQLVSESLGTVYINGKYINSAIDLMKRMIKHKKDNNYQKRLKKLAYTKYQKLLIGTQPDKIKKEFDTIYVNGQVKKIDSTLYRYKKIYADKDLWLLENLIQVNIKNGQAKRKLIATRMAGFKNPLYELLAQQVADLNVYDDYYKFMFQKYLGPVSRLSLKQYRYEIDDTIHLQGRPVIVVNYKNTKKPLISGKIYLDRQSLAITKLTINAYKDFQLNALYNFKYYPAQQIWFPESVYIKVKKAEKKNGLSFGGGAIQITNPKITNDSIKHSNPHSQLDYTYGEYILKYTNVLLDKNYPVKIRYSFEIDPKAAHRSEAYWQQYTGQAHTERELKTYKYADSIVAGEDAETKIYRYKRLIDGYYPVTQKIDLDLINLLDYNRYEGFRIKLGGRTNENFSGKWQLNAYMAYGFKDKALKYHLGSRYKISHQHQTFVKLWYTDDLEKSAGFNWLERRSVFRMPQHINDDKFYRNKHFGIGFQSLIGTKIKVAINLKKSDLTTLFDIPYHRGRIDFKNKDEISAGLLLEWTPFTQYYLRPEGRSILKNGYPKIYINFEKNMPQWQTDPTDYYRISAKTVFKKTYLNKNFSILNLQAGYVSENPGIYHLFSPPSNLYGQGNPLQRFSLQKDFAFETMKDVEFADNFMVAGFLQHSFTHLKISKQNDFDLNLQFKAAWGLSYDSDKYNGIKSLDQGYYEAGLEFRKLFSSLGLGFYYRLGAYAYPKTLDNLSLRLTIDMFNLFYE